MQTNHSPDSTMNANAKTFQPSQRYLTPTQPKPQAQLNLKDFVKNILFNRGQVKNPEVLEKVTSGENLKMYEQCFVSPTVDPENNYENFEFLGDATCNKCIVFYFYNRFPQLKTPLGFKVMARLKILYVSKNIFQNIGEEKLGFFPYIKVAPEMLEKQRFKVLTDCFEAFIAVTEMIFDNTFDRGVGYAVAYEIVKSIFDEMNISLSYEALFDSITRLKELMEYREFKHIVGPYKYEYHPNQDGTYLCNVINQNMIIGSGGGHSQGAAQRRAAESALRFLKEHGFVKPLSEPWASLQKSQSPVVTIVRK